MERQGTAGDAGKQATFKKRKEYGDTKLIVKKGKRGEKVFFGDDDNDKHHNNQCAPRRSMFVNSPLRTTPTPTTQSRASGGFF